MLLFIIGHSLTNVIKLWGGMKQRGGDECGDKN